MKTNPFWLFTAALFVLLIVPALLAQGMFMDGMLYTCVARNLSEGIGTFWEPLFSTTWIKNGNNAFHEHPPLVFGIQAIFFWILGDSIYVERFYSLLTAVLTAFLIYRIWRLVLEPYKEYADLGWLPILCWVLIPVGFWSYQNNLQENTLGVFTTLAVYFTISSFIKNNQTSLALAGLSIFAATLSKGLPGLFPLAIPFLWWVSLRSISFTRMMQDTLVLLFVPAVIYTALYFYEPAANSLQFYLEHRVFGRIETSPTVQNRFYTLGRLIQEIIPILVLGLLTLGFTKLKKGRFSPDFSITPLAIFFLAVAMAGIFPLLLTKVQKGFYMVPAFPFLGIGFALLMIEPWKQLVQYTQSRKRFHQQFQLFSIAIFLFVSVFALSRIPTFKKDANLIHDVEILGKVIPDHSTIRIEKSLHTKWALHTYLMRFFHISLDKRETGRDFYLSDKKESSSGYNLVEEINLQHYFLYKKVN